MLGKLSQTEKSDKEIESQIIEEMVTRRKMNKRKEEVADHGKSLENRTKLDPTWTCGIIETWLRTESSLGAQLVEKVKDGFLDARCRAYLSRGRGSGSVQRGGS